MAQRNSKTTAVEILYNDYKDHVYNYIYRLCADPHLAQDITQLTFLKVIKDNGKTQIEHPKAYLYTIARHTLFDHSKSKFETAVESQPTLEDTEDETLDSQPEALAAQKDLQEKVVTSIEKMPSHWRELMLLRYQEDLDYQEISQITGRNLNYVKVNLHRARLAFDKNFSYQMYTKIAASREKCPELENLLRPFAETDIPDEQLSIIEKHISRCKICSADAENLKQRRELFALLPLAMVPALLNDLVKPAMAAGMVSPIADTANNTVNNESLNLVNQAISAKQGLLASGKLIAAATIVASISGTAGYMLANQLNNTPSLQPVASTDNSLSQQVSDTDKGNIQLSALVKSAPHRTLDKIHWQIYDLNSEKPKLIRSSAKSKPDLTLPDGRYKVVARMGQAQTEAEVDIKQGGITQKQLVFDAGFLQLSAKLTDSSDPIDTGLYWSIYQLTSVNGEEKTKLLVANATALPNFTLNSGRYRIKARYGLAEAITEVQIAAGQTEKRDILIDAGYLQLGTKLKGNNLPLTENIHWKVYQTTTNAFNQQQHRLLYTSGDAQPRLILPSGIYLVEVNHGHASTKTQIEITAAQLNEQSDIVIDAGYLQLAAKLKGNTPPLTERVYWKVYQITTNTLGEKRRQLLHVSGDAQPRLTLASGTYQIDVSHQDRNTSQEVTVIPNKLENTLIVIP